MSALLLQQTKTLTLIPQCYALVRTLCSSTAKAPPEHYDIIIGGGGLVGTALAAALTKNQILSQKRILLLEGAPPFKGFYAHGYGNRVSAINHNTVELFKSINAWDGMVAARVKPVKQMQVWDACSDALIQFQHDNFASDVAYIVENDLMQQALYDQLKKAANVEVRNRARIEWVKLPQETGKSHSQVGLQEGDCFTCDLLIGADGANSLVRKQMGMDVYAIDYERMGLVATLQMSADVGDNSVAWQRFLPTGPVALLPLSNTHSSLVWSTTIEHAKQLKALPAQEFVDALNQAFYKEYNKNELVSKALKTLNSFFSSAGTNRQLPPQVTNVVENSRATFPLGFLHATSYINSGVALIGDAAHRIHPLAGQGVNLGFSDVRHLVENLAEGAYAGASLSSKQYLLKYEQQSLIKNVPIMLGVHGLQTVYSTTFSPVVLLRSLGLQFTQNTPIIKDMFLKRAMG